MEKIWILLGVIIPIHNGKHLEFELIGENFLKYDSIINLAHGKGHATGEFDANLKNQSIGIATDPSKAWKVSYELTIK